MPDTFSVLVAAPELPPADKTAQIIAKFTGGVAFDARVKAKHAWGFLGEDLSAADADRLAALAAEAGVPARPVPGARIVSPPPPAASAHWLRALPEGISYTTGSDPQEKSVPWDRVRLLAAVPLKEQISVVKTVKEGPSANERAVKMGLSMMTGLPLGGFGGGGKEVKKITHETELFLTLDVFFEDGGLRRLHVDAGGFNFSVLGDARKQDALSNFRTLLDGIVRAAGAVPRNLGVRGFLSGQPLAVLGYETRDDYEKELRWLLTLQAA